MNRYRYSGPIMCFGRCIKDSWVGETMAPTETKAKTNLKYQAKKYINLAGSSKIELPGKITVVETHDYSWSN